MPIYNSPNYYFNRKQTNITIASAVNPIIKDLVNSVTQDLGYEFHI